MFANAYQSGFISIFYSVGSNPLALWDKHVKNGHIRRVVDDDVKSLVLEIAGTNVATTYITCPIQARASLGVQLPFLVMIIKNMKRYFTFEIQILDDKDMRRRFRVSNFQSSTKVLPFCTTMPIGLSDGWNQVQFNLSDFTRRAYGRQQYDKLELYSDEDMPNEFKLFAPLSKQKEIQEKKKESVAKAKDTSEEQAPKKSVDKTPEDVLVAPSPMGEEMAIKVPPPDIAMAAPSPVGTGALASSEVDMKPEEAEGEGAPPAEAAAAEGEALPEGGEGAVPEKTEEVAAAPAEGESPAEAASEAAPTEVSPEQTATTEEPETTAEPATTEEPTTTEEPPATETVTTEEPAATEAPSESENEAKE